MGGQTEVRPVQGACRQLRACYKVEMRRGSRFPERELVRYECEQGRPVQDEDASKCAASHAQCWQTVG